MNRVQRKYPFWTILGPLAAYWIVQFIAEVAAIAAVQLPYMLTAYEETFLGDQQYASMQEAMEGYMNAMAPAMDAAMRYSVEIAGIAALCTIPVMCFFFRRDSKLREKCGVPAPVKAAASNYWTVVVFGLIVSIGSSCLAAMAELAFADPSYQQVSETAYSASFLVQFAVLGIVMPLAEELLFRGVIFRRYMENRSFWYSAVWSSLFFSLMHTSRTQMIYTFLLGLMLCWVYRRFGSFLAPVALHMAANIGSILFTKIGVFGWLGSSPLRMAGASIASAFFCSAVFVFIMNHIGESEKKEESEDNHPMNMFR